MTELTHAELTRLLDYDPETGVFRWRVDRTGKTKAGSIAGCRAEGGNRIRVNGTAHKSRRLAWFYVYGEMPRNNLFVKNGDYYDDRIDNLGMVPDKPKELTHEYLKQCIDYNPETGEFKWKISDGTGVYSNPAFCINLVGNNYIKLSTRIIGMTIIPLSIHPRKTGSLSAPIVPVTIKQPIASGRSSHLVIFTHWFSFSSVIFSLLKPLTLQASCPILHQSRASFYAAYERNSLPPLTETLR